MAVSFLATSESHTGTTGSTSEASFQWTHDGGASDAPKGVLVFVFTNGSANLATSVTYGGTDVPAVSGGEANDTAGEPVTMKAYFLGQGIATGDQTVVVNRTNNATAMWGCSITVDAAFDTHVYLPGISLVTGDNTVAEVSVNDGSPNGNSMRFAGGGFGHQTLPTQGTNSTALHNIDLGATGAVVVRETTAGTGSRSVGMTSGTSDDRAIVHLAIREGVQPAAASLSISGQSNILAFGLPVPVGAMAATGQAAALQVESPGLQMAVGSAALTGLAASLAFAIGLPAGSLALSGQSVGVGFKSPETGTLSITGRAPTILNGPLRDMPAGSLVTAAQSPSLGFVIALPEATLLASGLAPTIQAGAAFDLPAASLSASGQTPSLSFEAPIPLASVSVSGTTPSLSFGVPIPAAQVAISGQTPALVGTGAIDVPAGTLSAQGRSVGVGFSPPATGTLATTGLAPVVLNGPLIQIPAGSLAASGQAPAAVAGTVVPTGALALSGQAELLAFGVPLPAASLAISGLAPTVLAGAAISISSGSLLAEGQFVSLIYLGPDAAQLTLSGQALRLGFAIVPPAGALAITGTQLTLGGQTAIALPVGTLTLTGPAVSPGHGINTPAGALAATGRAATAAVDDPTQMGVGALAISGTAPAVATGAATPAGQVVISGAASQPVIDDPTAVPAGTLSLSGLAPVPSVSFVVVPGAGSMSVAGRAPAVGDTIPTGGLSLSGRVPTLVFTLDSGVTVVTATHTPNSTITGTYASVTTVTGTLEG